jgi:hypothetical protein
MSDIKQFIGKNWFEHKHHVEKHARARGLSTNLKVHGDVIEGTNKPLKDFVDICADDSRLTITICPKGKILALKVG